MAESDLPYIPNTRIRPFPYLQTSNFEMLEGATVSVEFGYVSGQDLLLLDYRGDYPITAEWKEDGGVLWLTGTAPASVYMTAISSVIFLTQSDNGQPRRVTWSFGKNTLYSSLTGHFYQYNTDLVAWPTAQAQCEAPKNKMFGMQGYLATITSANEMASVGGRMSAPQFIGATDLNSTEQADGDWKWATGPEKGVQFWKGHNQFNGGMPVNGQYSAWARFQPNDGGKPKSSSSTSKENTVSEDYLALKHGYVPGVGYMMDVAKGVQYGYICEFGGMDSDEVASQMGNYANSVVLGFSCELLEDGGDCTAASNYGCEWSSGLCTQSKCVKYTEEGACVADAKCEWSMSGDIGKCGNTLCGQYSGASACEVGGNCKYDSSSGLNGAAVCRRAMCYDMPTPATCANLPGCQFMGGMCLAQATYGCAKVDTVFLLDGSDAMKGVWGKASNGFQGLVDTLRQLPWSINGDNGQKLGFVQYGPKRLTTPGEMVGNGALNTLRTESRDVMADLASMLASFTSSLPSEDRKISSALSIAADMLKSDSSTNQKRIVIFAAGEISDAAAAASSGKLPANVDVYGFALKPSNQITNDGTEAETSLKALGAKATSQISLYDVSASVLAQCALPNPNPTTTCFSYTTRAACEADAACGYDFSVDACKTSACQGNKDQASCSASKTGCQWQAATATEPASCKNNIVTCNFGDANTCDGHDACAWNATTGACQTARCYDSPTEDSCIDEPDLCVWTSAVLETAPSGEVSVKAAGYCAADTCRKYDASQCTKANGCILSESNICVKNPCPSLMNKTYCENKDALSAAKGRCEWFPDAGAGVDKCQISECAKYASELVCGSTNECSWDVSVAPGRCVAAKCTGYNLLKKKNQVLQKQMCDSEPTECMWNTVTGSCERLTCDKLEVSALCAGRSECVWRDNQCSDVRNVQCPGIDVVIAVEATTMMGQTFGRHPNGFMGVLEKLREWGTEMNFAYNWSTAGFRTQLMLYGASAAKMFPANNGFFTRNAKGAEGWYGAGGELFAARDAYQKGPLPAGDTNLLAGTLGEALTTFTAGSNYPNGAEKRRKVLVILGHSPVTSEPNIDLDKTLTSLEEKGVEVFSNYIRRFSTLTPAEETAAQRLMPFTSDPRRTHFSYVSIDTLRPQFLDGFCNPTTVLGQAMNVSRNGVLPCEWLSGQTECEVQAGCRFDANAERACPVDGQCPSLGCQKLPDGLARLFKCANCELQNGAIKCEVGKTLPVAKGLCVVDRCMLNQTKADCGATNGVCTYDDAAGACVRQQCNAAVPPGYNAAEFCNSDAACVYVDANLPSAGGVTTAGCMKSTCGLYRDSGSCSERLVSPGNSGSPFRQCYFNKVASPAICLTSRCTNSDRTRCDSDPTCNWVSNAGSRSCEIATCRHASQARCEMDKGCYWNPDNKNSASTPMCQPRPKSCVLANAYSQWSACSASCKGGIQFRTRAIYAPNNGGSSCEQVAAANMIDGSAKLVQTQKCPGQPNPENFDDCATHCNKMTSAAPCAADISCYWNASKCHARLAAPCSAQETETDCGNSEGCAWDAVYSFCFPGVTQCKGSEKSRFPDVCTGTTGCNWNTGAGNIMDAKQLGVTSHLTNPGGDPILLFPTLRDESDEIISGATVTIEGNYSRGADMLAVLASGNIMSEFRPAAGTLFLWGSASVTDYMGALRRVTFQTTAQSTASRLVTWSLGLNVVYSQVTGHYYQAFNQSLTSGDVSYSTAEANCNAQGEMWGKYGYLAAVETEHENALLSNNLEAVGWISGQDSSQKQWKYTTGPMAEEKFWSGGPSFAGGRPAPNMWANWATDYPNSSATMFTNTYLSETGYWVTKTTTQMARGFICEFGGLSKDTAFATHATHGATVVAGAGCMPKPCKFYSTETGCKRDTACIWQAGSCSVGCGGFSSAGQCARATHCKWDDGTIPASCAVDICLNAPKSQCEGDALKASCLWTEASQCQYRTGCAKHTTQDSCGAVMQCVWQDAGTAGVAAYCGTRPCNMFTSESSCGLNSLCVWNPTSAACVSTVCKTGDEGMCKADRRCTWQDGLGGLAATFTPGGSPVLPFSSRIARPDDLSTQCTGVTVQIAQGFQQGMDNLFVRQEDNVQGAFVVEYSRETGTLVARTAPGVVNSRFACYEFLRDAVRFFTTSTTVNMRRLTYALGADMVANTNGTKLYQWVNQRAANASAAGAVCQAWATNQGYTGGKLAQISSQIDNLALRAMGAQGWLGATVRSDTNNWHWPGAAINFWEGAGATGALVPGQYAQWAGGEPRGATAETSRAFMVSSGFWKVVSPGPTVPKGVICEYESPAVIVYGFRNAAPFGCFLSACLGYDFDVCRQDPQCVWQDAKNGSSTAGQCAMDTWCTGERSPGSCTKRELCYWDYSLGSCRTAPSSKCSAKTDEAGCKQSTGCEWKSTETEGVLARSKTQTGVCSFKGCAAHPAESPCSADPTCRWATSSLTSACVPRLCGYLTDSQCWDDKMCMWDQLVSRCSASSCTQFGPESPDCNSENSCAKATVNNAAICGYVRCGTTKKGSGGKEKCEDDSSCLWDSAAETCASAGCEQHTIEKDCNADAKCYFTYNPNRCLAAQCTSNTDLDECEDGQTETAMKPCIWDQTTGSCRQPTFEEQNAPAQGGGICQKEEYGNLWWLWLLAAVILVLILLIFSRLYIAYKYGISFFEPARNTKTFSPHSGVGEDVFLEAQQYGEETNIQTEQSTAPQYNRPTADEL